MYGARYNGSFIKLYDIVRTFPVYSLDVIWILPGDVLVLEISLPVESLSFFRYHQYKMIDYHLHGNFCGHGEGDLEEYVRTAIEKGLQEIGFSAHLPKVDTPDPYHAMLEEELPIYVEKVLGLREKYSRFIKIKLGIEADYLEGYEEKIYALIDTHPFDYVIGSIHFLGDWHFTSRAGLVRYESEDPDKAFPDYFRLLGKMIRTGLFDIAGHPDAIKREYFVPSIDLVPYYRMIADALIETGMAAEVNTAGLRRNAGFLYPSKEFLEVLVSRNVPLTLGSDAHRPEDVGRDLDFAVSVLTEIGCNEVSVFERRNRESIALLSDANQS